MISGEVRVRTDAHEVLVKPRSILVIGPAVTTKIYNSSVDATAERQWYESVPWACPVMIDHGMRHLVLPTHPTAASNPNHRPARELRDLLLALEEENVHHRDVHPGNILLTPDGVRLIDWECAVREYGPSYDLYGPRPDLGPPDIHDRFPPQWWNSEDESSILNAWGVSLTDLQEDR